MSAMAYTDSQLKSIEDILTGSIETSKARYDSLISSLQQFEDVVAANRAELSHRKKMAMKKLQEQKYLTMRQLQIHLMMT